MAANEFEKNFTALDAIRRPRRKRPPRERVRSLAHGEIFLQRKTRSLSWRHRASLPPSIEATDWLPCSRFRRRAAEALAKIPREVRYIPKAPAIRNFGNARLLRIPAPEVRAARIQTHSKDVDAQGVQLPREKSVELPDTDAGVLRDHLRR